MTDHLPEVRRLLTLGKGEDAISRALGITRHRARALVLEVKSAAVPAVNGNSAVSLYDTACQALDAAVRVDEIMAVLDVRAAISAYARQAKNYELEAKAAVLRERAERRLGEKLIEAKKSGQLAEGRPSKTVEPERQFSRVTLEEAGISRDLSSRAQKKAGIAATAFEAMVERMRAGIASGKRVPDALKEGPINGARSIMGSRQEPDDSLDHFPTPPWATRALFERVMPHLGINSLGSVWEPACGEGHMLKVIEEYTDRVDGSDIHDYGGMGPDSIIDFVNAHDLDRHRYDWIITNPPFKDGLTERFTLRALDLAQVGVAMFVRSQWAVEGVDRYERIFRDRPPTLCAFFVERVNLCKGKWDPDGSTATAYCWLVWIKDRAPMPPFWIPPGCREQLTKADDRARFAAWSIDEGAEDAPHDPVTGEIVEAAE